MVSFQFARGNGKRYRMAAVMAMAASVTLGAAQLHADTVLLSEPFTGTAGTQPTGFAAFTVAGINSQLDGAGEYEQKRTDSNAGSFSALGWYSQPDITDVGAWRDTTTDVILRYSGGAANKNGVLVRASNVAGTNSGDYYHVRLEGDTMVLYRVNNGTFTNIASASAGGSLGAIQDRLMRVEVANVANPDHDFVHLQVTLYNGANDATSVVRTIDFTDTSTSAITRGGSVGVRTNFANGSSGNRATYDDLKVTGNNDKLLWYDDYYDNTARRTDTFVDGTVTANVTATKVNFSGLGDAERALRLIDFDAETSSAKWANVQATTLMRLNTNGTNNGQLAAGLVVRETGTTGANNGSGNYYHYRLVHDEANNVYLAQLYRVNSGVFSLLQSVTLSASDVPESVDTFLSLQAINEGGNVHLVGMASFMQDFAGSFGVIDIVDSSANRILGPGSAGFRVFSSGALTNGTVNFDNFTIISVPVPLALPAGLAMMGLTIMRRRPSA
ncbi:MAG: hypothetical protein GC162_13840 [Planctomycetes bacterium]|nr:hypothetical protein [Planctomycetota bacterium]